MKEDFPNSPSKTELGDSLSERIAGLSPAKRALLELRLKQKGSGASHRRAIPRRTERGTAPLSFAQERLWFLDQLEPGGFVYNRPAAVRLTGPLDVLALERSLSEILRRHEILRTTFPTEGGRPIQCIAPPRPLGLAVTDLGDLPESEREAQAKSLAREETQRPFELAREPLLRASLLRLGEEEYVLLLTVHHIVSDGWSDGVFWRELAVLYEAFSRGRPSPLPELPIQYAEFAIWQREWLQGEVLETQLSYWKRQLEGASTVLELPTDRPRPPVRTNNGAAQTFYLSKTLSAALKELSRREGVTLFMTLLAAFQTLLHRYTGQDDVLVGTPIAGRNRLETEGLIGLFINTLVLRGALSGNPSFRELLGRVREAALGAYAHQDLPFDKLVEELQPEWDPSRSPLFQVMFQLRNALDEQVGLPGLEVEGFGVDGGVAKVDLTLKIAQEAEGLTCTFEYDTDLFEADTVERMGGHFRVLLEGIVAAPEQRLSVLPLLTEAERRQLLLEWNDTKANYPEDRCVHELFEEQVERTPDAVAVVFENQQLTYRELNKRANQLAHHLYKLGVGPEVLVGLCVERSLEMVVGLLGILKAGGAYVPLDPSYPKERLASMLEDAQPLVMLTQERLIEGLPERGTRMARLDADWGAISREGGEDLASGPTTDDLAYVVYTSGSTGRPKGVCVPHRALGSYVSAAADFYEIAASDRVLQFASLNFDASVEEIFPCLTRGGTLVLRSEGMLDSMQRFVRESGERAISVLNLPTAFWHELVSALEGEMLTLPPSVRLVIIGGEEALARRVAQWHAHMARTASSTRLINTYGPTEATVVATLCELPAEAGRDRSRQGEVPIGRRLGEARVYILDTYSNPVPVGVPGELCIGGPVLARGYLNYPGQTAEKFIPHPFSDEPGARLYKTGDLARYLPDGNIEFVGRLDYQVKIRGFRVEPREVESILDAHADVHESVVVLHEDDTGEKRLAAYVVPNGERVPSPGELLAFMKEKVPDHMVPSAFVTLEALPLTPNGKIDRFGLPTPRARPEQEASFVAARTPTEAALAGIWATVLCLPYVGIYEDFFELGGHSLLAVQVMTRLNQRFGIELPLRALFEAPTVAGLAERIETAGHSDPASSIAIPTSADRTKERL